MHMQESTGPSKSSNVLSISAWARGDCLDIFLTYWRFGSARLLARKKLGKSRIWRKFSMLGTLLIKQPISSFSRVITILLISKKFDINVSLLRNKTNVSNKFH